MNAMLHFIHNLFKLLYLCCIAQGRQGKFGKYTPSCCRRHFAMKLGIMLMPLNMNVKLHFRHLFKLLYLCCIVWSSQGKSSKYTYRCSCKHFCPKTWPNVNTNKWMRCCIFLTNSIAPICVVLPKVDMASPVSTLAVTVIGILAMKLGIMLMPLEWRQYECKVAFSLAIKITLLVLHCPE